MSRFSKVLWSSAGDEWFTPQVVFDRLDKEFHFDLDPCATDENHKCPTYFKKEQDGLQQSWAGHSVFVNPPYSDIKAWVEKSYLSSLKPNTRVVMLVPARTDTKWFHKYVTQAREVRFIEGRLKFGGASNSAPFPSMIVVFGKEGDGYALTEASRETPEIMVHYGDRRYRLNSDEVPIMMELARLRLQELLKTKRDLEAARTLFRVLYRHEAYQPGRPGYPESITWGTLAEYLDELKTRAASLEEAKNYGN